MPSTAMDLRIIEARQRGIAVIGKELIGAMRVHVGNGDRRMRGNLPLNGNGRLHEVRSPEIGTKPFGGSLRAAGGERRARRYCREKIRIGHDVLRLGYPVVSLQGEDARDVEALIEPAKARTNNRLWLRS